MGIEGKTWRSGGEERYDKSDVQWAMALVEFDQHLWGSSSFCDGYGGTGWIEASYPKSPLSE